MRSILGLLPILLIPYLSAVADDRRPMTVDDLLAVRSVSDPQVSPDGKSVVYVVGEIDREAGKTNSDLYIVPTSGGEPKRLTTSPGADNHPRWSPDGKSVSFVSDRGGSPQVWLLPMDGGEARQLTKLPIGVSGPIWSPKGDKIAFTAEVFPGASPEETAKKIEAKDASKSKVRTFDRLMIRHWASWDEGTRSHLFVADASGGEAKDLTPGLEVNTPPEPFGGSSDYAFAPDGEEIAFTAEPKKDTAWSTNTDIWTVPVEGGEPKNLTADNLGADGQPAYSPDGRWLAYVRQARSGFEADQWVLTLRERETGTISELTKEFDRPVLSFAWDPGEPPSHAIHAVIDDRGTEPIVQVILKVEVDHARPLFPLAKSRVVTGGVASGLQAGMDANSSGTFLAYVHHSANAPAEIVTKKLLTTSTGSASGKPEVLTRHNADLLADLDLAKAEPFTFEGADVDEVGGFLIRPPGFDPAKKYPVLFLIHGGPQGAWHDEWHARWNYQMFAAPGFAVVAVNPRGSTGYGQEFTDQISRDWTGRVHDDLMKGLEHALRTYPFLDELRMAAAGGSYGGFMVNWIAGHSDRFKALVSHAGVFDLESMYATTEELWFPDWEFGGPPWSHPELYREQSPSHFVGNFKTPTLVIHGALDFRVPDAQGLGMFTGLQKMGVPSRYAFFPDEGHWILKPANRVAWWGEVHDWLKRYLH